MAVTYGLALAPYSHVHPAGTATDHHSERGDLATAAVRHAHFTPHDDHDAAPLGPHEHGPDDHHRDDETAGQITPANDFLFQPVDTFQDPAPAALVQPLVLVPDVASGVAIQFGLPPVHGPPVAPRGPARAPPIAPPAAI